MLQRLGSGMIMQSSETFFHQRVFLHLDNGLVFLVQNLTLLIFDHPCRHELGFSLGLIEAILQLYHVLLFQLQVQFLEPKHKISG